MRTPQKASNCFRHAILGACIGLAGCTSLMPAREASPLRVSIPPAWVAGATGAVAHGEHWWHAFGDPQLNALINEGIAANHDLTAAAARIAVAQAEARIAGADLVPQISGGFDAARARQNVALPTGGPNRPVIANSFGISLDVGWEIDLWGRVRAATRAAVADLDAQRADYAAAVLSLAGQIAKTWYALTEARLQVELAAGTVKSYGGTARRAKDRVQEGVAVPTDMHLSEANLASAEAFLRQREEVLRRSTRQLEILLARYPVGGAVGAPDLPSPPPAIAAAIPAEMLRARPDLRAAERRLAAAGARTDAARAALLPRLSLTASGGTASQELSNMLSGDFLVWTLAGNLVQPIFQGGRLRAQVDQARGRYRIAAESYAQNVLQALFEVEAALSVSEVLAQREAALVRTVNASRAAVSVAENRFEAGVETFLIVLESQRRVLDAESSLLAVRRQRLENRIDLHLALADGLPALLEKTPPPTTKKESTWFDWFRK